MLQIKTTFPLKWHILRNWNQTFRPPNPDRVHCPNIITKHCIVPASRTWLHYFLSSINDCRIRQYVVLPFEIYPGQSFPNVLCSHPLFCSDHWKNSLPSSSILLSASREQKHCRCSTIYSSAAQIIILHCQ